MAAKKVFWQDPYLTEATARVVSLGPQEVALDRTIFYAFAGGQESDSGTIGGREVLKAEKRGLEIYYTLASTKGIFEGDEIQVTIDWDRRYSLMRLHFAAELVLEIVNQRFEKPLKIGAHIAPRKARIDFVWEGSIARIFPVLQRELDRFIEADRPIVSTFSDEALEERYWEIVGFARVPCGGTHLRSTGEIGPVKLKRENIGKGKERIEIFLAVTG
ncbi:MAG: alanyl-tRNA editing protein [Deltaproteobacteria bacterium]|nr:alanyl-tRNA editing protein [Deltaproteobacteria bacterium]